MRAVDFRERVVRVYAATQPCAKDRHMARWLHGELHRIEVKVSKRTVYNWLNAVVTLPAQAWQALDSLEADAVKQLMRMADAIRGQEG